MTESVHIEAARGFNRGSALLAFSALVDSAVEHYRGGYENRAMYTPLATASAAMLAGLHGHFDRKEKTHIPRQLIYLSAAVAGLAGTGFHLYNVTKRPGGWSWHNLFYAAPLGAPSALLLSGALGAVAETLRDEPAIDPILFGMPAGRALALLASAGMLGTVAEMSLLHFRGAFQHRAMYAPLVLPPLSAIALIQGAVTPPQKRWYARAVLRLTNILGFVGVGFHLRGVIRQQGGLRNWTQNILSGPPLPAPPSFSALALAGLAALRLRATERRTTGAENV